MNTATQKECTIAGLYDLLHTIGKGHFAVVKLAKHVFTGEKVAVKVIDKTKLDHVSRDHLFQEVRCMKLVQHPHIVRLYEVIDTQTKLYLILELGDGDMYDYIMDKHDRGLDIESARMYFFQILEAISYCHALRVVHRDLKPENVIFFEKLGLVKLTDFGFSNRFEPDTKLDTSCGSLAYSAPEILLGDSYDAPAVDVWSLGVLLYMLVTGEPPFQEANDSETLTMIMDCKYRIPPHIPTDCANLISLMLRREPHARISLDDIINHPWLKLKSAGTHCCTEALCTSLVDKEHLSQDEQDIIIQKMVEGGIATRPEILRALELDEYTHVTATFYLLAERKLKKQHDERKLAPTNMSVKQSSFHRSASQPGFITTDFMDMDSERTASLPSSGAAMDTDNNSNVFISRHLCMVSGHEVQTEPPTGTGLNSIPGSTSRRFSLIEEDEELDSDDLRDSFIVVKETVSQSQADPRSNTISMGSMNTTQPQAQTSDFEQSLSNMSLRRQRQTPSAIQARPIRTVTSSPQLLPLKQIHEEGEAPVTEDDALSTHSQTSIIRLRHSSLSMASPEVARKILSKKANRKATSFSDDTASETEEEKNKERERISPNFFNLPHKRKDSSDYSSDTDGAGAGGSKPRSHIPDKSRSGGTSSKNSQRESPTAKKRYSESTKRSAVPKDTKSLDSQDLHKKKPPNNKSANNSGKDDNSLLMMASKLVDSSLARLSNFSLASQTSSLSSRSSCKFSTNTTPRSSSKRRSKDSRYSRLRLLHNLSNRNFEFSELSDIERDSDTTSHASSIRLKLATVYPIPSTGDQSHQQTVDTDSLKKHNKHNKTCCAIM